MKKAEVLILIACLAAISWIAGSLFLRTLLKPKEPLSEAVTPYSYPAAGGIEQEKDHAQEYSSGKNAGVTAPDEPAVQQPSQAEGPVRGKTISAGLKAEPAQLDISIREGTNGKVFFKLTNAANAETRLNIYKSKHNSTYQEALERLQKCAEHQKAVLSAQTKADLAKASLFTGAPWLKIYPYYLHIASGQEAQMEAAVDTREMKPGEYKAYIMVLGQGAGEKLLIPLVLKVEDAPRIRVARVDINDGFSKGTKGDKDKLAEPAEVVRISFVVENYGAKQADDLRLFIGTDPSVKISGQRELEIPYLGAASGYEVSFTASVLPTANPSFPPSATVTLKDIHGEKWSDSFYLGNQENIQYPTGLIKERSIK